MHAICVCAVCVHLALMRAAYMRAAADMRASCAHATCISGVHADVKVACDRRACLRHSVPQLVPTFVQHKWTHAACM
jgi:hypothetical protein